MTSRHLITAALLALSAPAAATNCDPMRLYREGVCDSRPPSIKNKNNDHLHLPPIEYDKPFVGTVIENAAKDMDDMANLCGVDPEAGGKLLGCARKFTHPTGERRCYIYIMPDSYLKQFAVTYDAVRRHEIAHCNGWPGSHPRPLEKSDKGIFDPNRTTPGTARDPNKAAGE